jgi:hypothetical protein
LADPFSSCAGDPSGDHGRVGARIERGAVLARLAVTLGDLGLDPVIAVCVGIGDRGGGQLIDGGTDVAGPYLLASQASGIGRTASWRRTKLRGA